MGHVFLKLLAVENTAASRNLIAFEDKFLLRFTMTCVTWKRLITDNVLCCSVAVHGQRKYSWIMSKPCHN